MEYLAFSVRRDTAAWASEGVQILSLGDERLYVTC